MFVFVVPLKSPQASKSWQQVTRLFERSIKSICNQTSPDFRVIVVCNQRPQIEFNHPHITYIEVDFPPLNEPNALSRGNTDKGRKILQGLIAAKKFAPSHTMAVDADDCVSRRLAEFVNQNPDSNGWFVNKGYKYQDGSEFIYIKRSNFYKMCGSCNILRYDLNQLPENSEYNRGYGYYKFLIDHEKVKETLAKKGNSLQPLPFAGAVYMLETGEHLFYDQNKLGFSFFNRQVLTPAIRSEFCLYPLEKSSVPEAVYLG